jgi:hypothetical protein
MGEKCNEWFIPVSMVDFILLHKTNFPKAGLRVGEELDSDLSQI